MQKQFAVTIDGQTAQVSGAHPNEIAKTACRQLGFPATAPNAWWRQSDEASRATMHLMPRRIRLPVPLYGTTGEILLSGEIDESRIDGDTPRTFGVRYRVSGRFPGFRKRYRAGETILFDSLTDAIAAAQKDLEAFPGEVISITAMVANVDQEHEACVYYLSAEQARLAAIPQTR